MTSRWRWLLLALAAVVVSCLVPGSMLSAQQAVSRTAVIEAAVPAPSGSECAAVACNRGSPSAPGAVPVAGVVAALTAAVLVLAATGVARRRPARGGALPPGTFHRLLRPPQPLFA